MTVQPLSETKPRPATVGTKRCSRTLAPHITAELQTALLAIPIESLTLEQFAQIAEAIGIATTTGLKPPPNTEIGAILI